MGPLHLEWFIWYKTAMLTRKGHIRARQRKGLHHSKMVISFVCLAPEHPLLHSIFLVLYEALWYEHSSRDARAYSWNVEKLYTFHFLKKPFFIVKSGWLIHFSHSFGVFALVLISVTFHCSIILRGTQRKFSENICSEDDLRSRIFRSICCKIFCLPISPRIFEHQKMV